MYWAFSSNYIKNPMSIVEFSEVKALGISGAAPWPVLVMLLGEQWNKRQLVLWGHLAPSCNSTLH